MFTTILKNRLLRMGLLAGLLSWPATGWMQPMAKPRFQQGPTNPFVLGVEGEGRIVPIGGLLRLSAPAGAQGAAVVSQLLVKTGDTVAAGQLLAVMNTRPILEAQVEAAQQESGAAQAALEQAKVAKSRSDIELAAQLAELESRAVAAESAAHKAVEITGLAVEQARADQAVAQAALATVQAALPVTQAVSNSTVAVAQAQFDAIPRRSDSERKIAQAGIDQAKALAAKTNADLASQLAQLQAQLDLTAVRVKEAQANVVREPMPDDPAQLAPVQADARIARANFEAQKLVRDAVVMERQGDITAAQARRDAAQAQLTVAQAQLALSEIHAPYAGRILGIHARPGEVVGPAGVFDFGDTSDMFADVEIAYDEVTGVHLGQKAVISSDALSDNYTGQVVDIGPMVGNNELKSLDLTAFTDNRVIIVKVHLDKPEVFANLVNGQVRVHMEP